MKNVSLLISLWFSHHNETLNKILYMILLYIIIPCTVTAVTRCLIIRAPAGRCKVVHLHPGFCFLFLQNPIQYSCTESITETPSASLLQSEIRQQVLVFHKYTKYRNEIQ